MVNEIKEVVKGGKGIADIRFYMENSFMFRIIPGFYFFDGAISVIRNQIVDVA